MAEHPEITVLYVDDEKENLIVFKANFSPKFEVITSDSPELALEKLETHHGEIMAVISDMRMPGMNGIEFVRRARSKYKDIPYYILTGFAYNEELEEALAKKEIRSVFTKPFDADEIEHTILAASREPGRSGTVR